MVFGIWMRLMGKFLLAMALGIGLAEAVIISPAWLLPYLIIGLGVIGWGWYSYVLARIEAEQLAREARHEEEMARLRKRPRRTVF